MSFYPGLRSTRVLCASFLLDVNRRSVVGRHAGAGRGNPQVRNLSLAISGSIPAEMFQRRFRITTLRSK